MSPRRIAKGVHHPHFLLRLLPALLSVSGPSVGIATAASPRTNACWSDPTYLGMGTPYRTDSLVVVDYSGRITRHLYEWDANQRPVKYMWRPSGDYLRNDAVITYKDRVLTWRYDLFYERYIHLAANNHPDSIRIADYPGGPIRKETGYRYAPSHRVTVGFDDAGGVAGIDSTWFSTDGRETWRLGAKGMEIQETCVGRNDSCICTASAAPNVVRIIKHEDGFVKYESYAGSMNERRTFFGKDFPVAERGSSRRKSAPAIAGGVLGPDGHWLLPTPFVLGGRPAAFTILGRAAAPP